MRKTSYLIILLLAMLWGIPARLWAGQVYFYHFDSSNGLSENSIYSIIEDELGYVWLGTLNGLNRFDGQQFTVYKPIPGDTTTIRNNIVELLTAGRHGDVWAYTRYGGLNYYHAATDHFEAIADSLLPGPLTHLHALEGLPDGQLLLLVDQQVYRYNPVRHTYHAVLPTLQAYAMTALADGTLCIRHRQGLSLYRTEDLLRTATPTAAHTLPGSIQNVAPWKNLLYYSTPQGVFEYDRNTHRTLHHFSLHQLSHGTVADQHITSITYDGDRFWIIADHRLYSVSHADQNQYTLTYHAADPSRKGSMTSDDASFLFTDPLHNTWIVTTKTGVNVYSQTRNRFDYYLIPQNVNDDFKDPVRVILPLDAQHILVAFDQSAMGLLDETQQPPQFTQFTSPYLGRKNFTRAMLRDSQGNVWISTQYTIVIYDPKTRQMVPAHERFPDFPPRFDFCRVIKEITPGTLVFGGNGLRLLNLATGASINVGKALRVTTNIDQIRDLVLDDEGYYWLCTDNNGIVKIHSTEPDHWQRIRQDTQPLHISNNKVYCIVHTRGKMWIGTHNGLNIIDLDSHQVTTLFEKNGLSDNVIYSLLDDHAGHLWASTSRGLNRIDMATLTIDDYLGDFYFMDDAYVTGPDGRMYFGGYDGFVAFDPTRFNMPPNVPTPLLRSFKLFNNTVSVNTPINGRVVLPAPLFQTDTITLDHNNRTFSFTFDAVPALPEPVRFRYKLAGYDDRWLYTQGTDRQASFTNVPPGHYTLMIETSLPDSPWQTPGRTLSIIITPPFWETLWFKLTTACLTASTLIGLYYYRLNRIKQRNLYLQQQVDLQTHQLKTQNQEILRQKEEVEAIGQKLHAADQLKLNIFTTISHEFRTPLTLILGHLDMLLEKKAEKPRRSLQTIQGNARSLLNLVNQLIEVRKNDHQKNTLQVSRFSLPAFCEMILQGFQPLAQKKQIDITLYNHLNNPQVWLDPVKTEHILYNLLSNAIKYTHDHGQVDLILDTAGDTFTLAVKDNGMGIAPAEQPFVFDTFYRANAQTHAAGHGIGLALVKSFVELMQGEITLNSSVGQGSTFLLRFKQGHAHFAEADLVPARENQHHTPLHDAPLPHSLTATDDALHTAGATILLVEDNLQLQEYIAGMLGGQFKLTQVANGQEALEHLDHHLPDLIISDIMMPVMDGITFCKKVKAAVLTSHIPMILLTAKTDLDTKIEGFELGVDDYVEKPFDPKLLEIRIKTLLKNRDAVKRWAQDGVLKAADTLKIGQAERSFLGNVNQHIQSQLANPDFSIEKLGVELGMSRSTFYRKFKALTGVSANDYLKKQRLHKAKALLEEGNVAISQLCYEVGFASPSHLRDSFRKEFAVTPSQYQKEFQARH